MYCSRLTLNPVRAVEMDIYHQHQLLWQLFADSPDRTRDFLFRALDERRFLVVSHRMPRDADDLWQVETKEYAPKLQIGERLLFSLRVNPVRKTRVGEKQIRHDIVQDLRKYQEQQEEDPQRPRAELAQQAAWQWLAARQVRMGLEAKPDTLLAESYQRHSFLSSEGRNIRFASLDLRGFATVQDPDALQKVLFEGIGPSKGFGCGLLLVRRA